MCQWCDGFHLIHDVSLLQNATAILLQLLQTASGFLLQNVKVFLHNATVIINCDNFIIKCDSYCKMRFLLQIATVRPYTLFINGSSIKV